MLTGKFVMILLCVSSVSNNIVKFSIKYSKLLMYFNNYVSNSNTDSGQLLNN